MKMMGWGGGREGSGVRVNGLANRYVLISPARVFLFFGVEVSLFGRGKCSVDPPA